MIAAAVIATGAAAAVVRYLVSRAFGSRPGFPWAVLVVNVVGSGIGGAVLGLAERGELSGDLRVILLTGLCGGLTTFSTFSVETIQLVLARRVRAAIASVAANLALGIGVAAIAYLLARG